MKQQIIVNNAKSIDVKNFTSDKILAFRICSPSAHDKSPQINTTKKNPKTKQNNEQEIRNALQLMMGGVKNMIHLHRYFIVFFFRYSMQVQVWSMIYFSAITDPTPDLIAYCHEL